MSETNYEDSSSRALNVSIQTILSAPFSNPKPEKAEKFDGIEFKRWQQKMLF